MTAPVRGYEFGPFLLDLDRHALFRGHQQLALSPKSFETLTILVEHAGAAVAKDTLLARVWSESAVEENSVAKAVSEVRRVLGDEARAAQFVVTLSGHGYRFVAPVRRIEGASRPRCIAVLPFSRLSGPGGDDDYLAIGLADSIITRLSRLREIVVRPTRAILPFAAGEHDAVSAGRQLGADSVLDGTIRRSGDRIRVTAQLVDVANGGIVWAHTFDEPISGMFVLDDVVSDRVVSALAVAVTGDERRSLAARHTVKPAAYEWDLRGRFHLARRTADDCRRAIAAFERAIGEDPGDAVAYSGIAEAYVVLGIQALVMGGLAPTQAFPRAKAAIEQALRNDPRIASAYTSQAQVSFLYDWDSEAAERAQSQALALEPHGVWGHHAHGMTLSFAGHHEAALASLHRARQLDPSSPIINTNLGRVLYNARQYPEAIEQLQWTVRQSPEVVVAHYRLGLALEAAHRLEEAIAEFEIAHQISGPTPAPAASLACAHAAMGRRARAEQLLESLLATAEGEYVAAPCIAEVWLSLGDRDRAFEWFDRAVEERSSMLVTLQSNHRYDPIRDEARFRQLVRRVGLWPAISA
jgi:TolB-like protein/tetratricopeptide (TPR) repeat protein